MTNIYKHFFSLFNHEKERLDRKITVRQDVPEPAFRTPVVVVAALLGLGVSRLLLGSSKPRQILEDHPMCGITTGGQAECYFDCETFAAQSGTTSGQIITNLECLKDCFVNQTTNNRQQSLHCLNSLIEDVLTNGICESPDTTSSACNENFTNCPPVFQGIYKINNSCTMEEDACCIEGIGIGTCSDKTEKLLSSQECINEVFEQQGFILNTILQLILLSCNRNISDSYVAFQQELNGLEQLMCDPADYEDCSENEETDGKQGLLTKYNRLAPAQSITEFGNFTLKTNLKFRNTQHRYPWVCSLRRRGASPEHLCAVSLISIPPKPTVVIGAAHCTYICKNENEKAIPTCCCSDDVESCADDIDKCGDKPKVYEMTGNDVIIICGEWETGDTPWVQSGEEYNVLLPIKEIVRYPNFNPTKGAGPIGGSDIAVFKVEDSSIQKKASSLHLYPICLPSADKVKPGKQTGIHSGWSNPPPFHFLQEQAIGYLKFYRDFRKQWHYKMDIEKCRDPLLNGAFSRNLTFPSNSYYPPGTVCAKDFSRQSCFSTGDSGSPLMLTERTRPMRFYAEGILSFVKGCDVFTFGSIDSTKWQLNQQTENPSAYTKLSCFLPWVAKQYRMEYKPSEQTDPECFEGQGDLLDGENTCRNTPSNLFQGKVECIFPFYYDGNRYDQCVLFDESGFVYPVFRCPIRNITTKTIDGINSFPVIPLTDGLCPTDSSDPNSELDPTLDCDSFFKRAPFSQCKNNCPGVRAFGIIGGGATLAFIGITSALQSLGPAAFGTGAIGVAGLGGNMVAQMMCFTPYCRSISGRCCLLVMSSLVSGLQCPDTC